MKHLILFFITLSLTSIAFGQISSEDGNLPPAETWDESYDTPQYETEEYYPEEEELYEEDQSYPYIDESFSIEPFGDGYYEDESTYEDEQTYEEEQSYDEGQSLEEEPSYENPYLQDGSVGVEEVWE